MAIKVIFTEGISSVTVQSLHQWDYGQKLEIEASDLATIVEVHFAYDGIEEAIVSPCSILNGVATADIPNQCLEQKNTITAWVYEIEGTTGSTKKTITIPVIPRQRPSISEDIPQEIRDRYTELITEVNGAVAALSSGAVVLGTAINANNIKSRDGSYKSIQNVLLDLVYPVGSVYMSTVNNSPAKFLGGTWVLWGAGRVPVGVDTTQTAFNTVEKTGGESTHILSVNEMPSHGHRGTSVLSEAQYRTPLSGEQTLIDVPVGDATYSVEYSTPTLATTNGVVNGKQKVKATYGVPAEGGGKAHNNLQPYITCYMWKRTA